MSHTLTYPFFIACAELTTRSAAQNAVCRDLAQAMADFRGCHSIPISGAYKGAAEISLLLQGDAAEATAMAICILFGQESILRVDSPSVAHLLRPDGTILASLVRRHMPASIEPDAYFALDGVRWVFA